MNYLLMKKKKKSIYRKIKDISTVFFQMELNFLKTKTTILNN